MELGRAVFQSISIPLLPGDKVGFLELAPGVTCRDLPHCEHSWVQLECRSLNLSDLRIETLFLALCSELDLTTVDLLGEQRPGCL